MRHKKRKIHLELQPRIDPREHHRTSHKPVGPLGVARTRSETTEEPSRIPTKMAGHPTRHKDLSAANKKYRHHSQHMARTGRRHRRR